MKRDKNRDRNRDNNCGLSDPITDFERISYSNNSLESGDTFTSEALAMLKTRIIQTDKINRSTTTNGPSHPGSTRRAHGGPSTSTSTSTNTKTSTNTNTNTSTSTSTNTSTNANTRASESTY